MPLDHGSVTPVLSRHDAEIRRMAGIQERRNDFREEFALATLDVSMAAEGTYSNSYSNGLVRQHAFRS